MYNIIIFKSTRNKLTSSGNIIQGILNYQLLGPLSNLWLTKELKRSNNSKVNKQKLSKKVLKP